MFKRMVIAALAITSLLVAGCSENATTPIQPVDTTPPLAPIMIGARANDGTVIAQWETNTEPDLAGYRVYVDTVNGPAAVTRSLLTHTYVFFTTDSDGGAINLYATAIDYSGNESSPSQTIAVNLHTPEQSSRLPVDDIKQKN